MHWKSETIKQWLKINVSFSDKMTYVLIIKEENILWNECWKKKKIKNSTSVCVCVCVCMYIYYFLIKLL